VAQLSGDRTDPDKNPPRGRVDVEEKLRVLPLDRSRQRRANIYIRKVETVAGELRNVEFETFSNVRDPRVAAR